MPQAAVAKKEKPGRAKAPSVPTLEVINKVADDVTFTPIEPLSAQMRRMGLDPALSIDARAQIFAAADAQSKREDEARDYEAKRAFWAAFPEMQAALPVIERKGESENGRAYGLYEDIIGEINPVLKDHGFGLSFKLEDSPGAVLVTCFLSHTSGHIEQSSYPFPFDTTGEKNDNQSRVSAVSYGKRTLSTAMLNVVTRGQDDDAAATSAATAKISAEQIAELKKLIAEAGRTEPTFVKLVAKVPTLADIRATNFEHCKRELYGMITKGAAA